MIYGITGGIGSGKTYVCTLITRLYGLPVYNTDTEAQRLMTSSPTLRERLTEEVGPELWHTDGSMDKAIMGTYLFGDESHLAAVNAIVHPAVFEDFEAWARRQLGDVVLESAILIESGYHRRVDRVVTIEAPLAVRIRRVMERDHLDREAISDRLRHQIADAQRARYAHHRILNDGTTPLEEQLQDIWGCVAERE